MTIQIKQDRSNSKVFAHIDDMGKDTRKGIREAFFRLGKDITREMNKEILTGLKSGGVVQLRLRSGRTILHQHSAPRQTHAEELGDLRRSRSYIVKGSESMDVGYEARPSSATPAPKYARAVEFGTRIMKPRPTIANAIRATQRNAESHFFREIMDELDASR